MDMDCVYYVVGGDRRSCYMSLTLAEKGYNVFHFDPYDADQTFASHHHIRGVRSRI